MLQISLEALQALLEAAAAHDADRLSTLLELHAPGTHSPSPIQPAWLGRTRYGRQDADVYSAAGLTGFVLPDVFHQRWDFCWQSGGDRIHAHWRHSDLRVRIPADEEVALYHLTGSADWVLDHAPATLGKAITS